MQTDKLDIKINEAADQYDPVYDEGAWSKMEKLLDEEMPQKKTKKRWLLWLFLLVFVFAGALLFLTNPSKKPTGQKLIEKANSSSASVGHNNTLKALNNTGEKANSVSLSIVPQSISAKIKPSEKNDPAKPAKIPFEYKGHDRAGINDQQAINETDKTDQLINSSSSNNDKAGNHTLKPGRNIDFQQPFISSDSGAAIIQAVPGSKKDTNNIKTSSLLNQNNTIASKKEAGPGIRKDKFSNSFALNLSAGPDVSAIGLHDIGQVNPVYGAGVSYSLGTKWNIKAGIYFEKKVYEAKPADYHPPARFWNYYPDLKDIDAACNLIEVPLTINYNFIRTQKHLWFAAVGISSYFMKIEDYNFLSKNPAGQNSYTSYTINNKNKHYLSSVRLSGGYEKKISNSISIIAEPYLNLPLNGIGYGKVKLLSSGILFTISARPFAKK